MNKLWSFVHYLESLLNVLLARSATTATVVPTSFVVDPTATPGLNIYSSLQAALAVGNQYDGQKILEFRGTQSVPPGNYHFADAQDWTFHGSEPQTILTFQDGASFDGIVAEWHSLEVRCQTSAPLMRATAALGGQLIHLHDDTDIFGDGVGGFLEVEQGGSAVIYLQDGSSFQTAAHAAVHCVSTVGGSLVISALDTSTINPNTLACTHAGGIIVGQGIIATVSQTQTGMVGGLSQAAGTLFLGPASSVAFTAAAGVFANPQPTTVQDATARIAALVKTLNGGTPIP